jgi:hypothetical protein
MAASLLAAAWIWRPAHRAESIPALIPPASPIVDLEGSALPAGPWGELRYVNIFTEKPTEFIDIATFIQYQTKWTLDGFDMKRYREWLENAGVPEEMRNRLTEATMVRATPTGLEVTPSDDIILSLPSACRQSLYNDLAANAANTYHKYPFCFAPEAYASLFEAAGVTPSVQDAWTKLVYKRGNTFCFSDIAELTRSIPADSDRMPLLKCLTRQSTALIKLVLRKDSDIASITRYWSWEGRSKDTRILLESINRTERSHMIDIIHLLPPFARLRLYTFPRMESGEERYDCHWSSMNFFERTSNDSYLDTNFVSQALNSDYQIIPKPEQLGDIIMLTTDGANVIHSCVYVAADIVFTKNGANHMQPWTLMRLDDVISLYPIEQNYQLVIYRKKTS